MEWTKRSAELLMLLQENEYRTAEQLAGMVHLSEKTVRSALRDLSESLAGSGVSVCAKSRHGYCLKVDDREAYVALRQEAARAQTARIRPESGEVPDNSHDRLEFLMVKLLYSRDYMRLDDLCDFLYVSRSALSHSLCEAEAVFSQYGLKVERRPNHGVRAVGREFDKRRLLADYFVKRASSVRDEPEDELKSIASVTESLLVRYDIALSENEFENFIDYTYVGIHRAGDGFPIESFAGTIPEIGIKEEMLVRDLLHTLGGTRGQTFGPDEHRYLEIYLAGKRMIGNALENDRNFVIREQTDRIAMQILTLLSSDYHMDLAGNFDLRMTLNQHLAPLDVRMRFDIPLKNPLLPDIKRDYPLAFQMGLLAGSVISGHYGKPVSEDEIGYLALILQLVLEKETEKKTYNILIVCSTGKSTSRLLMYRFEQQFGPYLNHLYVCDMLGIARFDVSKVDYIFTTVPIAVPVSVPIIEVGSFLEASDIRKIAETLRDGGRLGAVRRYFGAERFLPHFAGGSKEEVLRSLCRIIAANEQVDDTFYELVLKRESFVQADAGNAIALPHPNGIASEHSFAYCAVLDTPVRWNDKDVQVVILVSIGREREADEVRQNFYEAVAQFALSREAVASLIETPTYSVFENLLALKA
ncbi:MAG: BglG family transcription antiterminator [Eubacterium sp.]